MTETPSVSFVDAIKLFFSNYTNFKGRSRRSEYWWAILFVNLVSFGLGALLPEAVGLWSLITFVPTLSLLVRRLHDVGRSGWSYFICLIPLVGAIMLLIWICTDSTEDNQWGPNPKLSSYGGFQDDTVSNYGGYLPSQDSGNDYYAPTVAAATITLQLCTGPMSGAAYSCTPGSYVTLGRAPSRCEIVLGEQYNMVSGVHCRIQFYDQYATITDMNSTNGTYVNGTRLTPGQPATVQNGAAIYLGSSACAFQLYFN